MAAVLAVIYPGLGHAYLRSWGRALLWFGAVVLTAALLIPSDILAGISTPGDMMTAWEAVPTEAAIGVFLVAVFNVIDAYWTGKRLNFAEQGVRCPACGRPVDEDLSFCHWCTARLRTESA